MNEELKDILKTLLKIVIASVVALMLVGLLAGCRTKKDFVETIHTVDTESHHEQQGRSSQTGESFSLEHIVSRTTSTESDVQIIIYDTSLPPDSITGERPIKARANIKQRSSGTENVKDTVEAQSFAVSVDTTKVDQQSTLEHERATERKITRGSDRVLWSELIWGLVLAVLGIGIFYYSRKK